MTCVVFLFCILYSITIYFFINNNNILFKLEKYNRKNGLRGKRGRRHKRRRTIAKKIDLVFIR